MSDVYELMNIGKIRSAKKCVKKNVQGKHYMIIMDTKGVIINII